VWHTSAYGFMWYLQHVRSHNDHTALTHSFYDVVNASSQAPKPLRELRRHCLYPGLYAQHLQRWLDYFDVSQVGLILLLFITPIDSHKINSTPVNVHTYRFLKNKMHCPQVKTLLYRYVDCINESRRKLKRNYMHMSTHNVCISSLIPTATTFIQF